MSWRPPNYNIQGREKNWYAAVYSSHNTFCGCSDLLGHLTRVAARFSNTGGPPPFPGLDQQPSANLPALPPPAPNPEPPPAPRRGGGQDAADGGHGGDDGDVAYGSEDLELLFAAAEEDAM